jgi:hypothetical protein
MPVAGSVKFGSSSGVFAAQPPIKKQVKSSKPKDKGDKVFLVMESTFSFGGKPVLGL